VSPGRALHSSRLTGPLRHSPHTRFLILGWNYPLRRVTFMRKSGSVLRITTLYKKSNIGTTVDKGWYLRVQHFLSCSYPFQQAEMIRWHAIYYVSEGTGSTVLERTVKYGILSLKRNIKKTPN
jgi:hypothetical protein